MILKNVAIENFRIIENCGFKFDNKFNLIIGNNGTGKTSILEAITIGLGGFLAGMNDIKTIHVSKEDVRMIGTLAGEGSYDIKYATPTTVHCTVEYGNEDTISWTRTKSSFKSSRTTTPKNISNYASKLVNDNDSVLPIISYQSAGRMWSQKRDKWQDVFKGTYSRSIGYTDCLATESNIKMFTNWCKKMEQVSWQQGRKIAEYEEVKKAVGKFMAVLEKHDINSTIFYDKRTDEVVYSSDGEIIPMRLMSTGYRSLIGMVADIAYRMAVLNPNLKNEIIERTNGIILIDEIDLHIHPKWQWSIIDALIATFPNTQFIATTHSPIIIASCRNRNIISLFDSDLTTSKIELGSNNNKSPYGWQVNDVLNKFMGVDERIPELKVKLKRVEELTLKKMKNKLMDTEVVELKTLKEELYSDLPENDSAVELMELESIQNIINTESI